MNTLTSISVTATDGSRFASHHVRTVPVVVLSPHNQCNCRCVMCDIWRIREAREITPADLELQLDSFRKLAVRWVVFTGGEPQMNGHWSTLAQMIRAEGIRVTMLTAGLLLEEHAEAVAANIDDVIVSLDGPRELHNQIRRVANAFERITDGVSAVRRFRPNIEIRGRCTVQKANHRSLCAVVQSAKAMGLNSISFLAADLTSAAFNREEVWSPERQDRVSLSPVEIEALEQEIERLIDELRQDLSSGFVVESPDKLRRIVRHFRAHLRQTQETAPICNAPWVSAVIEASGDVRPCFFHPAYGNLNNGPLQQIVNSAAALRFRTDLDVATNPICQHCVCSLHIPRD